LEKFGVINTSNLGNYPNQGHDAEKPFAVVEFGRRHGSIRSVVSRHVSMAAATRARQKCDREYRLFWYLKP
jgi:hypothetical protein